MRFQNFELKFLKLENDVTQRIFCKMLVISSSTRWHEQLRNEICGLRYGFLDYITYLSERKLFFG